MELKHRTYSLDATRFPCHCEERPFLSLREAQRRSNLDGVRFFATPSARNDPMTLWVRGRTELVLGVIVPLEARVPTS